MISTPKTGAYISQLRKKQNMTQAEMAAKLMVSPQAVSKWETGQALPDAEQLLSLSQLFAVSINTILAGEDPQPVPESSSPAPDQVAAPDTTSPVGAPGAALDPEAVARLAPFVEQQLLRDMVMRCGLASFTFEQMVAVAPFLGSDLLNRYTEQATAVDSRHLTGLAPFVSPEQLEQLVDRLNAPLTTRQIAGLAPFLSSERLGQLFRNRTQGTPGELPFRDLVALAPFLPVPLLKAELEARPPRSFEELEEVAPFLDSTYVNQLARRLMGGIS